MSNKIKNQDIDLLAQKSVNKDYFSNVFNLVFLLIGVILACFFEQWNSILSTFGIFALVAILIICVNFIFSFSLFKKDWFHFIYRTVFYILAWGFFFYLWNFTKYKNDFDDLNKQYEIVIHERFDLNKDSITGIVPTIFIDRQYPTIDANYVLTEMPRKEHKILKVGIARQNEKNLIKKRIELKNELDKMQSHDPEFSTINLDILGTDLNKLYPYQRSVLMDSLNLDLIVWHTNETDSAAYANMTIYLGPESINTDLDKKFEGVTKIQSNIKQKIIVVPHIEIALNLIKGIYYSRGLGIENENGYESLVSAEESLKTLRNSCFNNNQTFSCIDFYKGNYFLYVKGSFSMALKHYKRAFSKDPTNQEALNQVLLMLDQGSQNLMSHLDDNSWKVSPEEKKEFLTWASDIDYFLQEYGKSNFKNGFPIDFLNNLAYIKDKFNVKFQ